MSAAFRNRFLKMRVDFAPTNRVHFLEAAKIVSTNISIRLFIEMILDIDPSMQKRAPLKIVFI